MTFVNQAAFSDPSSRNSALGVDLRASTAIIDPKGQVLAYAQTGGMMNPARFELHPGDIVFRFGSTAAQIQGVAKGSWWIERREFEKLFNFAQAWGIAVGMAMRALCLVPPEWNEATLLVRGRVTDPLMAWRGLANSVVTPAANGGRAISMSHQNHIGARRVYQLFVPGLATLPRITPGIRVEQDYPLDARDSRRGFVYT